VTDKPSIDGLHHFLQQTGIDPPDADGLPLFFSTDPVERDRVRALANNIARCAHVHDLLAARAKDDPELEEMVELSRKWWLIWQAMGLTDSAGLDDRHLQAMQRGLGKLQAALLARGIRAYKRFVDWATQDTLAIPYEPPEFIDWHEDWEKWERGLQLVEQDQQQKQPS
jgi:hypothetical protein